MRLWKECLFVFFLLIGLAGNAQNSYGQEPEFPKLHLVADIENPQLGDIVTVRIMLENLPDVYGADVQIAFDPQVWQSVGEPAPGDFVPEDSALVYELQNFVNNERGTLDYAMTRLNPAPPIQGDSVLLEIQMEALAETVSQITVSEALLGTPSGETISLEAYGLTMIIGNAEALQEYENLATIGDASLEENLRGETENSWAWLFDWRNLLIILLVIMLVLIGFHRVNFPAQVDR